ncbi:hypothetical protein ACIRPU_42365 [Streptomyces sp. NPDC102259]|uniref:hypothetical protein n=1 Tax=Streptomyces sp. NPDC102259 TaxID=3366148 RepID=UPI00380FFEB4
MLVHNSTPTSCWTSTNTKTASQNEFDHWDKHKSEFPHINSQQGYVDAAQRFMRSQDPWIQTKTRSNGDMVRFNRVTDEFGIMTNAGEMRTYYKPDPSKHGYASNQDYFDAQ